jgi:hypothetical protein
MSRSRIHSLVSLGASLAVTVMLSSCGGGGQAAATTAAAYVPPHPTTPIPPGQVVAQVGATQITGTLFDHWLQIGAAGAERRSGNHSPGGPVPLDPPQFTACAAHLKATRPKSSAAALKSTCKTNYTNAKTSALTLLITGDWVREAAAENHISLSEAEVEKRLQEEVKKQFPTPAAFHGFQEESLQSTQDVMFGIRSQMLTTLLFQRYKKEHGHGKSEKEVAKAYETNIEKWKGKTSCHSGFVVSYCRQSH